MFLKLIYTLTQTLQKFQRKLYYFTEINVSLQKKAST